MTTFEGAIMDYYSSAKGIVISHKRALWEIKNHGAMGDLDEFYEEYGKKDNYKAQDVLDWLGY
jgi:hypothetical protein